jgi:hypothetical protein
VFDTEHLPPVLAATLLALIGASYAVSLGGHLQDVALGPR